MVLQNTKWKFKGTVLPLLGIIVIWGVFILPSSYDPQWFFLDDTFNLLEAKTLSTDFHFPMPDATFGRYVPAYYLYYAVCFYFFDYNLTGYYIVQSLMFLLTLFSVYFFIFKVTRSSLSGFFAVFLIVTASPVAENFYTMGKPEPRILFYLLCAIYTFIYMDQAMVMKIIPRILSWLTISLLIIISMLTKETAVVIAVFAACGLLLTFLLREKNTNIDNHSIKLYVYLLVCSVCSLIFVRWLFFILKPENSQAVYTTYEINLDLVLNNFWFYVKQQPDVLLFAFMSAVLLIILYKTKTGMYRKHLVITTSLFFTALSYILGLLIWRWPMGYYLLVPASFFPISLTITLSSLSRSLKSKKIIYITLFLVLSTRLYSIPYFSYIAHAQKAQNKIYTEAVENYVQTARPGERLIFEQFAFFSEAVGRTNILIKNILGKEQLQVEGVWDLLRNMRISGDTNLRVPRKGDFILIFNGNRQSPWKLRGVSPFLNEGESAYKTQGFNLQEISADEVKWHDMEIDLSYSFPRIRAYSTGYKLYKVISSSGI